MRITLMNQFFPPARAPTGVLLHDLAETLRARGHQVTVVSSEHRYGRATGVFAKLVEYVAYTFYAHRTLMSMNPPPDAVVSMTTPPFLGLIAARLKKKKGVPFILWCMDLYPEALAANGSLRESGVLYRLISRMTRGERVNAACMITLGPDMTERVRRVSPDVQILEIPVWSRLSISLETQQFAQALRRERGWTDDETILMYSGNMGRAHRVEEFVQLAQRLRESGCNARMVFCGDGPSRPEWERRGGECFQWLETVDEKSLEAHLLSADIHLISQQPEWKGVVVPSKYQAACALGRPVIFAGPADSSVARWVQESGDGWVLPPDDTVAVDCVAKEISNFSRVGEQAGRVSEQFDRERLMGQFVEAVENIRNPRLAEPLPVTVVIPVLNEALNLPTCLSLLGDSFTEVVVVDSGSSDSTCEIAEQAGAKILHFQWDGCFPKKRNWTLRNYDFKTPWVLFLDADERMNAEFVEELQRVLPTSPHVGFQISFTNWFMGRPLYHGDLFRKLALFRVGAGEYEQFPENGWCSLDMEVHEHPILDGTIGSVDARIEHHDFRSLDHYMKKHAEYAAWEANRFLWLKTKGPTAWGKLTRRQHFKYRFLDKPGLGFFYFCVSFLLKAGFLDGLAGFRLAQLKWRYFDDIRGKINKKAV